MRVQVAIDLALDRLFTYAVPVDMEKKLTIGQLLLVPFGHRTVRAFAISIGTDSDFLEGDGGFQLKSVLQIVDETPFFSPQLLELVRLVAGYTASPRETVLKAAVPAAVLRPGARAREQLYVEAAVAQPPPDLSPRARWLYDQIVRLDGGWMRQLCTELKTTPSTLRAIAARGVLAIAPRSRRRDPLSGRKVLPSNPLQLNSQQRAALSAILAAPAADGSFKPVLLHGITGSGKTEVYLQAIAAELADGRGAIVLVPEIALTPQTVQRFASRFGSRIAVLHSALSDGERYDEWHRIRAGEAQVVIGPRSAVFAPVRRLGLIVVDEEHDSSYKQDETPRYHARDVAVLRAKLEGSRAVLGSATPALESWMNVERGKYALAAMTVRAGAGALPRVEIVDMNVTDSADVSRRGAIFSSELLEAMHRRLDRGEQTILFLNRRGWARSVTCAACGAVLECPDCSMPYTYHRVDACCRCHLCGGWIPLPECCPQCHTAALTYVGIGTQRAEEALRKCLPSARVLRMDADSTSRRRSHDDILGAFRRHEADVLIGTQMIAKGLDFPNVTLVGVLNADSSLNMPDFRAGERTFQLLAQVAGRAGRAELPGEVFIQTHHPDDPVIGAAARNDYHAFVAAELAARRELGYPPYRHLTTLNFSGGNLGEVQAWAELYARSLSQVGGIEVGEAVPSAIEKAGGNYRWQVVVLAEKVSAIVRAWRWITAERPVPRQVRAAIDIDAISLM